MIKVRRMQHEDIPAAARLEEASFSSPWSEQAFAETLECDYAYYYVAEIEEAEESAVIGICGFRDLAGEGEISNVAVDIRYRRMGIARKMLGKLLAEGQELGVQAFTLEVRNSNLPAIRLYENLGFVCEGVRKDFYDRPKEDALIMWKRQEENGTITTVFAEGFHV